MLILNRLGINENIIYDNHVQNCFQGILYCITSTRIYFEKQFQEYLISSKTNLESMFTTCNILRRLYFTVHVPAYQSTLRLSLQTYLSVLSCTAYVSYVPAHLSSYLSTHLPPTYLPNHLSTYSPTYLYTYLPACLPTFSPTCLPIYLPT